MTVLRFALIILLGWLVMVTHLAWALQLAFADIKLRPDDLPGFTLLKEEEVEQGWQPYPLQEQRQEQGRDLARITANALKQDWRRDTPPGEPPSPYNWLVQYGIFNDREEAGRVMVWEISRRMTPPFYMPPNDYQKKVRQVPFRELGDSTGLIADEFGYALYVRKGPVLVLVYGNQPESMAGIALRILGRVPDPSSSASMRP